MVLKADRCDAIWTAGDFAARCTRRKGHDGEHRKAPEGTPLRSIRIPDEVWHAAKAKAEKEGTTVSAVVVAALTRFTRPPRSR
jgi:hypothetical protein